MAGKSIDDLHLDDRLLPSATDDPRGTEWYAFVEEIEEHIAGERVAFAEDTLHSIAETVERTKVVTEAQRRAVRNIVQGARAARERRSSSRRYEGFHRS